MSELNLKKWARDNNPNLKLEDGETVVVKYMANKLIDDPFKPGEQKIQYTVELDGKVKYWASKSGATAIFFDGVAIGSWIEIHATGEGLKRRYTLKKTDAPVQKTKEE